MFKFHALRTLTCATLGILIVLAASARAEVNAPAPSPCQPVTASSTLLQGVIDELGNITDLSVYWRNRRHLAALADEINQLQADGLRPEHYRFSSLRDLLTTVEQGQALDTCSVALINHAYISALADLRFGRVDPGEQKLFWYAKSTPDTTRKSRLLEVAAVGIIEGIDRAFSAARPSLPEYQRLSRAYQLALQTLPAAWTTIPDGGLLRAGAADDRVALVRQRLKESGYLPATAVSTEDDRVFSRPLAEAVMRFQVDHYIKVDGVVGPNTIREMNIQPAARIEQLRANLERLRWFANDIEETMVVVDIAGAKIYYTQAGSLRLKTKAQVGRPSRETPPLKSRITYVTLNPTWTVPPTILKKDVLPAVRRDINYLKEQRMRVFDHAGNELAPESIDWRRPGAIIIRQDAGPHGALGRVAFRFANPFAVFLHDTPSKKKFARNSRFFSSGCVRVEQAETLSELLFEDAPRTLFEQFIESDATGKPINLSLPTPVHLLMVYWTASVQEEDNLRYRPDSYDRDRGLLALLDQP